jgi:hypothetical protein
MNRCALISVLLLLSQAQTHAATPTLTSLFPAGGARGQTVEVTASGSFDRWPLGAWVDEAGVTIESTPTKGKLLIRIAPDARPGTRLIRLYSSEGATEVRPFVVGTIPEILEVEPNDEPAKVQAVVSPTVVNGRLGKRGDVDVFAVTLSKGQTLVAALDGNRRLGSPMDAVLQVASPLGFVLEQVDDAPGLDPKLVFKAPDNGTYHVRVFAFPSVQNSTIGFAGGDAFIYRLTLNTGPSLERTMPMAIGPEGLGIVDAIGRDIPSEGRRLRVESTARGDRARAWHPRLAGDVELPRLTYPSLVEAAGSSRDKPQALAVPCAISGRVSASGEEDVYQFHARASQTLRIRVEAQSVGSPLDPIVRVLDASGKVVAEQDDIRSEAWDVDLSFKVPADGAYRLVVRDLNRAGGLEFVYLLHVADPAEMMLTATLAQGRSS